MTPSNDVLVASPGERRSARRQVCDHLAGLSVFVRCPFGRFSIAGHGSHRGAAYILFRKWHAGSNIYLPQLSVRHVSDGIA